MSAATSMTVRSRWLPMLYTSPWTPCRDAGKEGGRRRKDRWIAGGGGTIKLRNRWCLGGKKKQRCKRRFRHAVRGRVWPVAAAKACMALINSVQRQSRAHREPPCHALRKSPAAGRACVEQHDVSSQYKWAYLMQNDVECFGHVTNIPARNAGDWGMPKGNIVLRRVPGCAAADVVASCGTTSHSPTCSFHPAPRAYR